MPYRVPAGSPLRPFSLARHSHGGTGAAGIERALTTEKRSGVWGRFMTHLREALRPHCRRPRFLVGLYQSSSGRSPANRPGRDKTPSRQL